ncbi:MAG: hypothetical protein KC503_01240 [Myxococcales bacterium]|nr:hypothetical protein [Myxococcales bacterium]
MTLCACPPRDKPKPGSASGASRTGSGSGTTHGTREADAGGSKASADARRARAEPAADLPDGKPWPRCDGALSFDDIPNTPLRAVVAGKRLEVRAAAVRGSLLGRSISFDFAQPLRHDKKRPCFIAETRLAVAFERHSSSYNDGLALAAGRYRLGDGWRAAYRYETRDGRRVERRAPFYGLLIVDSVEGIDRKPLPMFTPTGRAKGRVALCFKDGRGSFVAGTFDIPVCGDAPTAKTTRTKTKAKRR